MTDTHHKAHRAPAKESWTVAMHGSMQAGHKSLVAKRQQHIAVPGLLNVKTHLQLRVYYPGVAGLLGSNLL
jgi:hypothetical protein